MTEEEIIKAINIEEVVSDFVQLTKSGSNLKGISPFVNEKTPSFFIVPSKQIFKCFGSGKGGNAVDFLMSLKNFSHAEAIKYLKEKFQLEADREKSTADFKENSFDFIVRPTLDQFKNSSDDILELLKFDDLIVIYCKNVLQNANERVRQLLSVHNPSYTLDVHIQHLDHIKQNESLKPQYQTMYNQCLSLLVMNFTSCVKNLFILAINHFAVKTPHLLAPKKHSIKLSFEELRIHNFDLRQTIGQVCVETGNISFQDMASTLRAYDDFLDVHLEKNELIDDLIIIQASRHCIVHSASLIDTKFLNQIKDCSRRTMQQEFTLGELLNFSPNEIKEMVDKMKEFLRIIVNETTAKLTSA